MMFVTRGVAYSVGSIFLLSTFISVCHSCPKGYYGSPCTACPPSTYKDYSGDAVSCKSCPVNSGHTLTGSTSPYDCKCFVGYQGYPELGNPCYIRICEQLLPPVNGVIVGVCNRVYLSVCRMTCNVGYEAVGSVERQCVVQGSGLMTWTGQPWTCRG